MEDIPKIQISLDALPLINELLKSVYSHYPVGYWQYKEFYSGYKKMEEIVNHKLNFECNDSSSPSNVFAFSLRNRLADMSIENRNYLNYPNYNYVIHVSKSSTGQVEQRHSIEICISLLCNYYTMYIVNEYALKKTGNDSVEYYPATFATYSFSDNREDTDTAVLKVVQDLLFEHFPQKEFVKHSTLMSHKITSVFPFRQDVYFGTDRTHFSLFDLLFNFNSMEKINILE
jgi:hypothetical protein